MYFLNITHKNISLTSHDLLTFQTYPKMIYALSRTSQTRLSARVSVVERQHRILTLAQKLYIFTLVDRAVQEDGIPFVRAVDNLQVSAHSVRRWRVALQDPTNPQVRNGVESHHRGPAGFLDDIQEELIAFVTDWRDR